MDLPEKGTRGWSAFWFAKYAAFFVFPVLILAAIFFEHDGWFLGLAIYWFASISFLAWRSAAGEVGLGWRIALGFVMGLSLVYSVMLVFAAPGDTKICYDRLIAPTRASMGFNLGPSPYCEGTRLQDVQVD